jgi:hypothetical protein
MESIVEAGELRRRRKDRLRGRDQRESLRDVQRGEVYSGSQMIEDLRGDELMFAELRTAMHYSVSDSDRRVVIMLPYSRGEGAERLALGFVNAVALQ